MEVPMVRKLRSRMTYANVVSTIALGLAIGGGTAYAATRIGTSNIRYHAVTGSKLSTNSVTASKVKNSALSGSDIRDNSLHSGDIHNGTLQAADFAGGQLPKGDKGDKGDPATSIFGVVTSGGGLTSFKNVAGIAGSGPYTITLGQDVSKCAAVATLNGGGAGNITAEPTPGNAQQITVHTYAGGGETPRAFQFAVYC
jgi:uncharacterized protein YjbI with pentapeptide repeats